LNIALFDRKEPARIWPILINAAEAGAVRVLLQERALENELATSAAAITFSAPKSQRRDRFLFAEVCIYKSPNFAPGLSCPKLCLRNFSGAKSLIKSLLKRAVFCPGGFVKCPHLASVKHTRGADSLVKKSPRH
jgi:hypothetical protein